MVADASEVTFAKVCQCQRCPVYRLNEFLLTALWDDHAPPAQRTPERE